jgi:hypothetical protein
VFDSQESYHCLYCRRRRLCRRSNAGTAFGIVAVCGYLLFVTLPLLARWAGDLSAAALLILFGPPVMLAVAFRLYQGGLHWRCGSCGGTDVGDWA